MIAHSETHSVNERSFVLFHPQKAHQANQLHTNPSVKSHKAKREKYRVRKGPGGKRAAFPNCQYHPATGFTAGRSQVQQELLPTTAQIPTLGKYFHGSQEKPVYQLKGVRHNQLNKKDCNNKRGEMLKEKARPRGKMLNLMLLY